MELIFFIIRLPFFLVGFPLWIGLGVVLVPLNAGYFMLQVLSMVFGSPLWLIDAAFQNHLGRFKEHCNEWRRKVATGPVEGLKWYFCGFEDLFRWLLVGPKNARANR